MQLAAGYQLLLAGDASELWAYGSVSTLRPAGRAPRCGRLSHAATAQLAAVLLLLAGDASGLWAYGSVSIPRPTH